MTARRANKGSSRKRLLQGFTIVRATLLKVCYRTLL